MTNEQKNRLIAGAIGKESAWACPAPMTAGRTRTPIDFASPARTLNLIAWAAKQAWWWKENEHGISYMDMVDAYLTDFTGGDVDLEWLAPRIRDLVAEAIQESKA